MPLIHASVLTFGGQKEKRNSDLVSLQHFLQEATPLTRQMLTCASASEDGAAGLDSSAYPDANRREPPADVPDLLLSALHLGHRRTPTPARAARLASVAPLTQLNPESKSILPKNKHRVPPSCPSAVISVFFFCLSMGPDLPCFEKIPQSMRWGLGGDLWVAAPSLLSAAVCWGVPAQAQDRFPLLKERLLFTPSGLGIRDGGSES